MQPGVSVCRYGYCSGCESEWSAAVNAADQSWDQSDTTVAFLNSAKDSVNDVRLRVSTGCASEWGKTVCLDSFTLGLTQYYDEFFHTCFETGQPGNCHSQHSRPDTYWYVFINVNDTAHVATDLGDPFGIVDYDSVFQEQATVAHELGHAASLGEEPVNDACGDASHFESVEDYDCLDYGVLNGPVPWDFCGVNHVYYDPNWGYAGC